MVKFENTAITLDAMLASFRSNDLASRAILLKLGSIIVENSLQMLFERRLCFRKWYIARTRLFKIERQTKAK